MLRQRGRSIPRPQAARASRCHRAAACIQSVTKRATMSRTARALLAGAMLLAVNGAAAQSAYQTVLSGTLLTLSAGLLTMTTVARAARAENYVGHVSWLVVHERERAPGGVFSRHPRHKGTDASHSRCMLHTQREHDGPCAVMQV